MQATASHGESQGPDLYERIREACSLRTNITWNPFGALKEPAAVGGMLALSRKAQNYRAAESVLLMLVNAAEI
jgi:hypothetical protein